MFFSCSKISQSIYLFSPLCSWCTGVSPLKVFFFFKLILWGSNWFRLLLWEWIWPGLWESRNMFAYQKLQGRRLSEIGRELWRLCGPTPCKSRDTQSRLPWLWKISRDNSILQVVSITCLGTGQLSMERGSIILCLPFRYLWTSMG